MDQSAVSKKCVLILMEVLKRPEQLVIGIFPMDLETFTSVSKKFSHSVLAFITSSIITPRTFAEGAAAAILRSHRF